MNRLLNEIYLDAGSSAYLAGTNAVYKAAKLRNPAITLSRVRRYLEGQPSYTLHRQTRRVFPRNRTIASGIDSDWQIDLMDLRQLGKFNGGYNYVFTCIDVFSKFMWAVPTKSKKPEVVLAAFEKILAESDRKPWKIMGDRGMEWNGIKDWAKRNLRIFHYATSPDVKAGVVERAIRTIKTRMWKHFTHTNTFRYVDILPKLMRSINSTPSRVTRHRPDRVTLENEALVRSIAYNRPFERVPYRYKVGDIVRITTERGVFAKGYAKRYSEETFRISAALKYRRPATYRLEDLSGDAVEGVFYEPELVRVRNQ